MGKVTTKRCDEGTKDMLDGKPLRKGQRVKVKFPDGHTEQATVTTTTTTSHESHGRPLCYNDKWTEHHVAAYIRIIVHGAGLKFRLAEHKLDVERIKLMGAMKRYAEDVSVDMGFDGVINDEVMVEAQRRLDEARRTNEDQ